jgi:DNA polymerase elongation subunit (family B)
MRILALDIETAPNTAHVWGLFKQNIAINQIQQTGRVLCFAAKWVGSREPLMYFSEKSVPTPVMLSEARELLNEADAVVSYNGRRFDMPTLNKEFVKHRMLPPSPYLHIDLLPTVRKQFRFTSNKLDHVLKELGLGTKVRHTGHEMWTKCMEGDEKAWRLMERYNKGDVTRLIRLYQYLLPWIDNHPNHALYMNDPERPTCTNCGSHKLQSRGIQTTKTMVYNRYQCTSCGTWLRGRFKVNPKNTNVLTQAR